MPGGGLPALASLGQPPENRVWQLQLCAVQNCAAGRAGGGGPDCSWEVARATSSSSGMMKFREHSEIWTGAPLFYPKP